MYLVIALALVGQMVDMKEASRQEIIAIPDEEGQIKLATINLRPDKDGASGEAWVAVLEQGLLGTYLSAYSGRYRVGPGEKGKASIVMLFSEGWKLDSRNNDAKDWVEMKEIHPLYSCLRLTFEVPVVRMSDDPKAGVRLAIEDTEWTITEVCTRNARDTKEGSKSFRSATPLRRKMTFNVNQRGKVQNAIPMPREFYK